VSVTVNGNTVTSGTLIFTVPGLLTITSMSPAVGFNGETVTINVQGANLTNASFAFLGAGGIGISNVNVASSTQANFTATIGQVGGSFVLVGTNDFGPSSPVPSAANTFHVYFPPGDNYALTTLSVFNTYIPPGTIPGVPAGSNAAFETLSVFNTYLQPGTTPGVPAGSNAAMETLSVFNTSIPAGTTPGVPAGSNAAFQLFSTDNTATGVPPTPTLSIVPISISPISIHSTLHSAAANVSTLVAGQTVEIDIASRAGFLPGLQFRVNGEVLASSNVGYLKTYFTVPYGANSLTLQAAAQTAYGEELDSAPAQIPVIPDGGLTIAGRAVDGDGRPVASAPVMWQANGLKAEYFQFNRQLSGIPDLTGLQPTRTAYVSALNYPNPQQVFGQDPMGVGLGQNYAARFSGKLSIAVEGDYQFQLNAHPGAQLSIDGVTATDTSGAVVSVALTVGVHDLEAIYYESGGSGALQLLWTPPGGLPGVVPPSVLSTAAVTAANAGADGRFQVIVPAALSGVQVSIANGQGSVVLDQ
jgi:hypothetical protein